MVSEARARQMINKLTDCQGISDVFGQRASSSTEDQHTHILSRYQRRVRSASLELHRGSTHSHTVKVSATCSISEPRAPQRINTLTSCQGISDVFRQRALSSRGSTHSRTVKGSATCSVSEPRAPEINTLTPCQGISDMFGQRASSSTEDQHTHVLSMD
jgi:hypothetical protein